MDGFVMRREERGRGRRVRVGLYKGCTDGAGR